MTPTDALTRLGGVAAFKEARRLTSRRRLRSAVTKGQVVRVSPGVYALPGCDAARLAAASVGGVVSHLSAAQPLGLEAEAAPERPAVTTTACARAARAAGSGGRDPPLPLVPRSRGASPSHRPPDPASPAARAVGVPTAGASKALARGNARRR